MKFFGELIALREVSTLGQVEAILGQQLIRAEVMRIEIDTLKQKAERETWQQRWAALAIFALVGAILGCVAVVKAAQ